MEKRVFFNYLLIESFLEKHLSFAGRRLFKELLSIYFNTKRLKNIIEYSLLENKIGCDKNVIKALLEELQKSKLAEIQSHTEDKVSVIIKMDIQDKKSNSDNELIGKAIDVK